MAIPFKVWYKRLKIDIGFKKKVENINSNHYLGVQNLKKYIPFKGTHNWDAWIIREKKKFWGAFYLFLDNWLHSSLPFS